VVAAGENLTKIGRRYGVSVDALVRANNLASPDHIEAGKALTIP
jgi:LysM repeat protein